MSKKFTIAGSLAVTEDISVKNLTVTGKTTTENQETLSVKDNLIITNAEGVDLQSLLSGLAIRKDSLSAYGIVYDPSDDSVKLGLGSIVEGEFKFDENEGLPVVVRGDLVDGNLVQFSSTGNKLVDSGKGISELVTFTDYAKSDKAGVVKTSNASGFTMLADGRIAIVGATDAQISGKTSYRNPIMPNTIDKAVKVGITTNTETLSDMEKTDACKWLGAIPNAIPAGRNFGDGKLLAFNTNDVLTYTQIITGASGDEKLLQYTIPIRGETGVIYGATPTTDWGLTPKKYVDEAIASAAGTKVLVGGEAVAEFDADTKVGFTDYATTTKVGLVKNAGEIYGIRINPDNGGISLAPINNAEIEAKSVNKAIKASNLDYAIKVGVTTNTETLTDEEKDSACAWIGAVPRYIGESGFVRTYVWNGAKKVHETMVISTDGGAGHIPFYSNSVGDTEVRSFLVSATPTKPYHVANKLYVDSKVPNYRLIQDITLEEDTKYIELTMDKDGNPLNLKSVFIFFNGMLTKTSTKAVFQLFINGGTPYQMWSPNYSVTENTEYGHYVKSERIISVDNKYIWQSEYPQAMLNNFANGHGQGLAGNNYNKRGDTAVVVTKSINKLGYGRTNTEEGDLKAGSRIIIWGIDDDE